MQKGKITYIFCVLAFLLTIMPAVSTAGETAVEQVADTTKNILPISSYDKETYEDLNTVYPMDAPNPSNLKSVVEYDPVSGLYILRTYIGDTEIASPYAMSEQEYYDYSARQAMNRYWREKDAGQEKSNEDKFSLTDMKFDIGAADKLFGPGGVQVKVQGSADLTFGIRHSKLDNPAVSERMRRNTSPAFEQKIQLNANAKVGTRVNFNMNYNTGATFDFDQKMLKLAFKGEEDDIIQNLEIGNVSMSLNNSLISGSSALFGAKTDLKFGKLRVSAIATQQQSETQRVNSKGGTQTTDFEVNIDDYDENRHFLLAHFFRENFNKGMSKLPLVLSGVKIVNMEVWVTNKRNSTETRNVVAFMDLGEKNRLHDNSWIDTDPDSNASRPNNPANSSNTLYEDVREIVGIRNIENVNNLLATNFSGMVGGEDYEKIESARRLDASEYSYNEALGTLSLRSALTADEVLGVAFEYEYNGTNYTVGELSTGSVKSPETLIVKMLKGSTQDTSFPLWDLMMKNVYYLGAMQLQSDDFRLDIVYRNDSIGTDMQYITEGNIKNKLLLRVMGLDRLNQRQKEAPDGKFDYVEGLTVQSNTGRIIFPVLEPFGEYLEKQIGDDAIAKNYSYPELYSMTKIEAQEYSEKNKFRLTGEYKASAGNEIRLNAMNVPRGSVSVTAGGRNLIENVDYTVDYTGGSVTILDQSLLESNTNIEVKLENQSMFNLQRKSLFGTHIEYDFSKNFTLGGTIMHLSEKPLTNKVNTGSEPISNTIWGLNTAWRGESQWVTNMLNKLPFVNATQPSTFAVNAEFAQLIPGHSKDIGDAGYSYLDDFEATKTNIDIHYPVYWKLSSTPSRFEESTRNNDVSYGYNRSLLSWYYVDPVLNGDSKNTPSHLRNNPDLQSKPFTRNVSIYEIYPNREILSTQTSNLTVLNLSYYPTERGPYNLDIDGMGTDGKLKNPEKRWGGIMRKMDTPDFETSNIEYIEFWMMDPFIYDETRKGGDLYFNLGDISEDVLKDGKKFFENGLKEDRTQNNSTVWGYVPREQSIVRAFDTSAGARGYQDVGMNGLTTEEEKAYGAYKEFIDALDVAGKIVEPYKTQMKDDPFSPFNDPGGDNYHHYRGSDYDAQEFDILRRYKYYNGTEGNSPEISDNDDNGTSATRLPDVEDINEDNTLNEYEKYFEYKISLTPDMTLDHPFITEIRDTLVRLRNGQDERVRWIQFKVPLSEYEKDNGVKTPRNFKSIRFMRMYLTNFQEDITLRFATLDLVRGEWRTYTKEIDRGVTPAEEGKLDVLAVNIEENSNKSPVNYVLPPGVSRQTTPGQVQVIPQNEQAMVLRVTDLGAKDGRAVYKKVTYDMRQYKRLQMFVHAEKLADDVTDLQDQQLTCFIRMGTDMTNNYYEYEIPLVLTPAGYYSNLSSADRWKVWPKENMFDFSFDVLTEVKLRRNSEKQQPGSSVTNLTRYWIADPKNQNNIVTVVGNPTLSEVKNIMIGIRNNSSDLKSGEIWVNELRMSEFDEDGGWAAMANVAMTLSDIASINVAGRKETAGFGSIESTVQDRRMDDLNQINISTSADLGRFLPEKAKIVLPTYFSYSKEKLSPRYDPLDQDVLLSESLENLKTDRQRDSLTKISNTVSTAKSFNVTNAKVDIRSKKPKFYDPANLSVTYAYSESNEHSPEIEKNQIIDQKAALNYNFSFGSEPVEPFKNVKALNKPIFKIIKDFNFYYLPASISFNTDMNSQFSQVVLRDLDASSSSDEPNLTFSKDFLWSRQFNISYNPARSITLSLQTATNATVKNANYDVAPIGEDIYDQWRREVWESIRDFGKPYSYQQSFNASWNVPINKIPIFSWINANATYNSTYAWDRGAEVDGFDSGNTVMSMGEWKATGQFNFEQLYGKVKYLKDVDNRMRQKGTRQKFESKTYTETITVAEGQSRTINHRLGSNKVRLTATDRSGRAVTIPYQVKGNSSIEISPRAAVDSVLLTIVSLDPNQRTVAQQVSDISVRALMMVRRASVSYRQSNTMSLPGYMYSPSFLGQSKDESGKYAPGIGFSFGFFDEDKVVDNMRENGWLYKNPDNPDATINPMAAYSYSADFDAKASVEPFVGFKIELNARYIEQYNKTTQYAMAGNPTTFTGNMNITTISIKTAFKSRGSARNDYQSDVYDTFLANRKTIADRLNKSYEKTKYPNQGFLAGKDDFVDEEYNESKGNFTENSADVLIPAFLAAYTGRDVNKIKTSPLVSLSSILPNWRITYDGLTRIQWVKDNFRSVSLTHGYTSRYTIGAYSTHSSWIPSGEVGNEFGFVESSTDAGVLMAIPSSRYSIPSVSLVEQFNPLIGVNVTMKNSVTAKVQYNRQRNLSLNLQSTQLIEGGNDEFVVGLGYTIKDFNLIIKMKSGQSKVKNDLKINVDVSYKDNKMLLRKIDEGLTQATSGNKALGIKVMADYILSSRINLQVFFDHQGTTPLISSSFPISTTNFGLGVKFMLTR